MKSHRARSFSNSIICKLSRKMQNRQTEGDADAADGAALTTTLATVDQSSLIEIVQWLDFDDMARLKLTGCRALLVALDSPYAITRISLQDWNGNSMKRAIQATINTVQKAKHLSSLSISATHPTRFGRMIRILEGDDYAEVANFIKLLPASCVTHLKLAFGFDIRHNVIANLPPCLTHLDLAGRSALTLGDASIAILPRSLSFLALRLVHRRELYARIRAGHADAQQSLLSDQCVSALPRTLTHLVMHFALNWTDDAVHELPRNLTFLDICSELLTDECICKLPRSLTGLKICCNDNFSHACVTDMPSQLTSLCLKKVNQFVDASIGDLPRSLLKLDLRHCYRLTDACIADMPRCLTSLNLSWNERLTKSCIRDLPPCLTSLNLRSAYRISGLYKNDLPAGMVRYSLAQWYVGDATKINRLGMSRVLNNPFLAALCLLSWIFVVFVFLTAAFNEAGAIMVILYTICVLACFSQWSDVQ